MYIHIILSDDSHHFSYRSLADGNQFSQGLCNLVSRIPVNVVIIILLFKEEAGKFQFKAL